MPDPGLPHIRTISNRFLLPMITGAYVGQSSPGTQVEKNDVLACVEVLELQLRIVRGSKDLVNGTGSSWRKYSSGVWKVIPTLEAKSLKVLSTHIDSLKIHIEAYLSEHA